MSNYEIGYRDRVAGKFADEVERHFSGGGLLDKPDDWFAGFNDATDDLKWRTLGVEQMQFGL